LAGVFQIAILWIDVLILAALRPDAQVGVYAAVSRTVAAGTFVLQAVRLAVAPQISSLLATNDRSGAQDVFRAGTAWLVAVSWPVYIVLAVFAPVVLRAFGAEFVQGQHALQILALAMLVDMSTGNISTVLLMGGKSTWNLINTGMAVVVNVVLNLILIPHLGIAGAAYAWAASIVLENAAALIEVEVLLDLHPFGAGYAIVVTAAVACFAAGGMGVRSILGPTTAALLATIVLGGAVYVLVVWRYRAPLQLSAFSDVLRVTRRTAI
jgi:O-antigen/teichoic acid export membrane protein